MKPGIYDNIPNAEYHSGPGVSNSGLALIRRSPLHYRAKVLAANDNHESTPAQALGTAFHAMMLEPELFVQQYTLGLRQSEFPEAIDGSDKLVALIEELNKGRLPKISTSGSKDDLIARVIENLPREVNAADLNLAGQKASELKLILDDMNADRAGLLSVSGTIPVLAQRLRDAGMAITLWSDIKAEWMANNGHRNILEPEQWDQLHSMRDAVMAHPAARSLISAPGKAEQSVYWIDKETGMLCRCRPDKWNDNDIIVDLKTTEDASMEGFGKSIANWRYHVQAPFYRDGCTAVGRPPRAFVFLAVEKTACVVEGQAKGVGVYILDENSDALGRAEYRADLATYAECTRTNVWPCYGDKIQTIGVPQWQFKKNEHLLEAAAS